MSKKRRSVFLAMPVLVVVGLAIFGIRLAPWITMPSEPEDSIQKRFQTVRALAERDVGGPDDGKIAEAGRLARRSSDERGSDLTLLQKDTLSEDDRRALALLDEWHTAGGSLRGLACDEVSRRSIEIVSLARLALQSADKSALSRAEAIARLGKELRHRGLVIEVMVGFSAAKLVARWSKARGVRLPQSFERYRPEMEEIRAGWARDAVCSVSLLGDAKGWTLNRPARFDEGPHPPFGIVRMPRERLVAMQYFANLIEAATPHLNDPDRLKQELQRAAPPHVKSVVLSTVAAVFAPSSAADASDACREFQSASD